MDPAEFLTVRLAEVETAAKAANRHAEGTWFFGQDERDLLGLWPVAHMMLHSPGAVLAQVTATRAVMELHTPAPDLSYCVFCGWGEGREVEDQHVFWPCAHLKLLATGWGWEGQG